MHKRRIRWETMGKGEIQLSNLAEHHLITCRTEGKTASTLRLPREVGQVRPMGGRCPP